MQAPGVSRYIPWTPDSASIPWTQVSLVEVKSFSDIQNEPIIKTEAVVKGYCVLVKSTCRETGKMT